MSPSAERLLQECEDFLADFRASPSRFGREACSDPKLIYQLRRGREPTARTAARIRRFMREMREEQKRSLKGTL